MKSRFPGLSGGEGFLHMSTVLDTVYPLKTPKTRIPHNKNVNIGNLIIILLVLSLFFNTPGKFFQSTIEIKIDLP
jgi:hypothetical protein